MAGIVVAPQPLAAEAGAEALRRGGNAFDAAVAAAFMQAATDPFMCGIGGMGVATVHVAATGETLVLDFYGRAGSATRPDLWVDRIRRAANGKTFVEGFANDIGYASILIPGTVAGLGALHRRWGRLAWSMLVEPAARRLQEGYPLFAYIADYFHYPFGPHMAGIDQRLRATKAMAQIWLRPDGGLPPVGEVHRNPDYARSLERIADDGPDTFYRGELGGQIADDFQRNGALITAEDLANYQPRWTDPVAIRFRDVCIRSSPAPGGGVTVLQALKILEGYPLQHLGHNSPEYLHLLVSALKAAFADRSASVGDPAFVDVPQARLLSDAHAMAWREAIDAGRLPTAAAQPTPGTTHLTVADDEGNVVSLTHTLGSSSAGVSPGLGFQYKNGPNHFDPLPGRPNPLQPD
ncbi:MAG: gamma-glutamyltransferase, partial [Bacillota bacterium]